MVTGRHEDVVEAKREIECAAEHFTQIRASRRHSQVRIQIRVGSGRLRGHPTDPFLSFQGGCPAPGHVTAYVRVPLRVVGLVVGPKGNTIKRIQQVCLFVPVLRSPISFDPSGHPHLHNHAEQGP